MDSETRAELLKLKAEIIEIKRILEANNEKAKKEKGENFSKNSFLTENNK